MIKKSSYVDIPSIMQIIGGIYICPELIDKEEKYHFYQEDFTEEFHKILFGSIYNLYKLGASKIDISTIEDYLSKKQKSYSIYKINNGEEYLKKLEQNVKLAAFDYYYSRMKKMTLFRMYEEKVGMDLKWLYDPNNILNIKEKEVQEEWLDNTSIEEIAEIIDNKITDIRLKYINNADGESCHASEGILELLEDLKINPEVGYPLFGSLINTITRGARLGKFYLRSAAQGVGKSRGMVADMCYISCDELYDSEQNKWIKNGTREPCLYIPTEQKRDEVQTMIISFISDVDEEKILNGTYEYGEWERVLHAVEVLKRCPLYIQEMSDFSLQDIENAIKIAVKEKNVKYFAFDYIFSSMKILSEVSSKARIKGLREDNILFMIGSRIKDLCNEYNIFIESATQLSGDYKDAKVLDQSYLRGAKSLGDKIDIGTIMVKVTKEDIEMLQPVLEGGGFETPSIKISIYKNRRGKYTNILLWCRDRRGVCKIEPMFATTYNYEFVEIEDLKISVKEYNNIEE